MSGWLVVTPARNEATRLPLLAKSLADQDVCPIALWVIVDDGSTDGTSEVVKQSDVPFPLLIVQKKNDGGLRGGSAFTSFFYGAEIGLQQAPHVERILKLDADVVLARGYFKALTAVPDSVGLVGGIAMGWRDREQTDLVPGFLKAYNRAAYEIVRELPRAIGLDMADESALRHAGYEVQVVHAAHARLTRQIGDSEGLLHGRWRNGVVSRWTGYHPIYFALRVARYLVRRPVGIGALALILGYLRAGSGPYPAELKEELRRRQARKLRALFRDPLTFLRSTYSFVECDDSGCCAPPADSTGPTPIDTAPLCGIDLHALTFQEAADRVISISDLAQYQLVVTANVDHVVLLQKNAQFRRAYEAASIRVADGVPLVILSRLVGKPLPGRVNGTNLIFAICDRAARLGLPVAFVGGETGVADEAAQRLCERFPGLKVALTYSPPMGFDSDDKQSREVADTILMSGARVTFLGLGAPRQEIWAERWLLGMGEGAIVCIGGGLDYVSERKRRAPAAAQRFGLEWLFRLATEPRRLWRRYLVQDAAFFGIAFRELLFRRSPKR